MTDFKLFLPKFDGSKTSDFGLWLCRLEAVLEDKGIAHTIAPDDFPARSSLTGVEIPSASILAESAEFSAARKKAAAIIINGLGDKPLRVVVAHRKDPALMLIKLNERYASSTLSTRMSLISELYTLSYVRNKDMGEYVDTYTSLLNRLEAMNAPIPGALAVIMFLSSLQGHFEATVAAIRSLSDDDLTWDDVTSRLIEEASSPRSRTRQDSAFVVNSRPMCTFCGRQGHDANRCFTNPANPNNRLGNSTLQPPSLRSGPHRRSAMVHSMDSNAPVFPPPAVPEDIPVPQATAFATEQPPQRERRGRGPRAYQLLIARAPPAIMPDVSSSLASPILIDSGASAHMCPHREWFTDIRPCAPSNILLGDDSTLVCKEEGTIQFTVHSGTRPYTFLLSNTLYTPALRYTLISCSALSSSALHTYFAGSSCSIYDVAAPSSPVLVARCTQRDGLYFLISPAEALSSTHIPFPDPTASSTPALDVCLHSRASSPTQDMDTWHRRLGHTGTHKIRSMLRAGQLPPPQNTILCNECILGKQHRHPFHGSIATATRPGDVIHSDVVGPLPPSHSGSCYLVTFVDEFTRYVTIFALTRKSAVLESFKVFHREFERLHTTTIKAIHSDNGGEYAPVAKYALQLGISVHRSAPYTPQSNGIAERQNRSIFEMARTTLNASGLPPTYWVESVKNAVYIRNRLPDAGGVSPFEKLFGRAPSMSKLRPFGCLAYMLLNESKRKKLDIKSKKCILLANLDYGNYRLLELTTRKVHVCRHVTFTEDQFPARAISGQSEHANNNISNSPSERGFVTSSEQIPDQSHESDSDDISDSVNNSESESSVSDDDCNSHGIPDLEEDHDGGVDEIIDCESSDALPESEIGADVNREHEAQSSSEHPPVPPRRSSRVRRSENEWRAFQAQTLKCHAPQERDVRIPNAGQTCHIRDISESDSPSLKSALNSPSRDLWEIAIAEELESLREAGTWDIVEVPRGAKIFPSKLVLKVKRNSDGTFERRKARLVLLGNLQRPDIDFYDTYAPVADFVVVRIVIATACAKQWTIHHLDVKSAFLNGYLDEDIYMSLPREYSLPNGTACKLKRSIYGLRQAPRAWNKRLTDDLKLSGFQPLINAESVFSSIIDKSVVYLIIYVDDILVVTASELALTKAKTLLSELYKIKDLGNAEYFLGVKIEREHKQVKLTQESYTRGVLERYGMFESKPTSTPMVQSSDLMLKSPCSESDAKRMVGVPYREAIGSLLFLAVRTRPDIAVAVSILSKHVQCPRPCHWEGIKRVLRYLKGTMSMGLTYNGEDSSPALKIYCDADWATDPEDRHSRSGVVCFLGKNLVSWSSRKQSTPSVSSCEAEYVSLFEAGRDAVWIRSLMCELGLCPGSIPTQILHDNQGSIAWAEGGLRKVKHVELKYHHSQYLISTGQVKISYVASELNAADCMTKALTGTFFQRSLQFLNIT